MKIIVTGGTGYIGSHTVVELLKAGFEVAIIDNLYNSEESVLDRIETITSKRPAFEAIDLCDNEASLSFFRKHQDAVAVIHFAALKAVGESVKKAIWYYENNLGSTFNLFKCMNDVGIPSIIFSSSATIYGKYPELPVKENSPKFPTSSPYGSSKQMIKTILKDTIIGENEIKNGISLRYFNPIGAHESALIGEAPKGIPNNLLPYITQTAIGLRDSLSVFGADYDTPDGTAVRDYIHVVDLAHAHVKALQRLVNEENETDYEVFNIGAGKGYSVLQVIEAFERMNDVKVNYKISPRRPGDEPMFYADSTLAQEKLNWQAELNIDEMVASAWKWEAYYREHLQK